MKKLFKYAFLIFMIFISIQNVNAESISSITMNIYIDSNGDAHVTETWVANPTEKTEYYHAYHEIGNSKIENFVVADETSNYTLIDWNPKASFSDKAYKYGYNYTNNGVELCFGKSSYDKHTYVLYYTITSFVSQVDDADIVYWNLLDSISPSPSNVNITISSDTPFSDNLDVWGYGYNGYAYVYDGKIYMSTDGNLNSDEYMVTLIKFPKGTFNTTNILDHDFNYYYEMAEKGVTHHEENGYLVTIIIIFTAFFWVFIIMIIGAVIKTTPQNGQKYRLSISPDDRKMKDVPNFRDIPCGKDIFKAYYISYNYGLMKKQTDLLGAVLLKWLKEKRISINKEEKSGLFSKEKTSIILNNNIDFLNDSEKEIYDMLYEASKDGILESREFEKWSKNNYKKIFNWFNNVLDCQAEKLIENGNLIKIDKKSLFFKYSEYEPNSLFREDIKQVKGLRKFLIDFTNIKNREAIEVMLYDEYLMFASIFGIAAKVAKQFKELYPDYIQNYDFDYDDITFINTFSSTGVDAASLARSRAESYTAGGGGFSSSGGGGGSFGGGGGGSR